MKRWLDIGDACGNCGQCGGTLIVESIDGRTDFDWRDEQENLNPDMEFDLIRSCSRCGELHQEGAIYYDQLWDR